MHIHKFEKLWIALGLLLIVGFIGTIAYGALGAGVEMVSEEGGQIDPAAVDDHPRFGEPGVYKTGPGEYDVYVVARQFLFQPGTNEPIRLPAGSNVTFYVTSADVVHGFSVTGTNVNTMVIPGQVARITVRFDEPRKYGLVCHEYCGAGHHTMAGNITVMPDGKYNASYYTVADGADGGNGTGGA